LDETTTSRFSAKKLTLEKAISHAANILGRTFEEVLDIYDAFASDTRIVLHVIFWWKISN
jgi:hypothetical protein